VPSFSTASWTQKCQQKHAPIHTLIVNRLRFVIKELVLEELGPLYHGIREEALMTVIGELEEYLESQGENKMTKRVRSQLSDCIAKLQHKINEGLELTAESKFDPFAGWDL
jgi:hypothetical protein